MNIDAQSVDIVAVDMPNLTEIKEFNQILSTLGSEPEILSEKGTKIEEIPPPEQELSEDLKELLETPAVKAPAGAPAEPEAEEGALDFESLFGDEQESLEGLDELPLNYQEEASREAPLEDAVVEPPPEEVPAEAPTEGATIEVPEFPDEMPAEVPHEEAPIEIPGEEQIPEGLLFPPLEEEEPVPPFEAEIPAEEEMPEEEGGDEEFALELPPLEMEEGEEVAEEGLPPLEEALPELEIPADEEGIGPLEEQISEEEAAGIEIQAPGEMELQVPEEEIEEEIELPSFEELPGEELPVEEPPVEEPPGVEPPEETLPSDELLEPEIPEEAIQLPEEGEMELPAPEDFQIPEGEEELPPLEEIGAEAVPPAEPTPGEEVVEELPRCKVRAEHSWTCGIGIHLSEVEVCVILTRQLEVAG